jgi:hypothetical protein
VSVFHYDLETFRGSLRLADRLAGPVKDTTGLCMYPKMNTLINQLNPKGRYAYCKATTHRDIAPERVSTLMDTFSRITNVDQPAFKPSYVVFHYLGSKALVRQDLAEQSCYNARGTYGNVLVEVKWDAEHGPELLETCRAVVDEMIGVVGDAGEGSLPYGNAGTSPNGLKAELGSRKKLAAMSHDPS